jgi:D-sedoheptulose 7-phosphate isomerase
MPEYPSRLKTEIEENIAVTSEFGRRCLPEIVEAANLILASLRAGGKVIAFGNGGSAAEAEHFIAELVGRYRLERSPLAAISLTTDSAVLTSIGNDYGFEQIFSRQLSAIGKPGDIAIAMSTSGNSPNVLAALESARTIGLATIGLTGKTGGKLRKLVDVCLRAPSDCTARIQEVHTLMVHLICGIVEETFIAPRELQVGVQTPAHEAL